MSEPFDMLTKRAIKTAIARHAYNRDIVRICDPDMTGFDWLVTSPRGVFAVAEHGFKIVIHGWFFGIHRCDNAIYLFENSGLRDRSVPLGRIVRIDLIEGRLANATVLVTGLHANCHQLAIIDGLICLVDTANQAILRFALDGTPVDVKHPFRVAPNTDSSGVYVHMNSIAKIGSKIAIMLHNGTVRPEKKSELAWLDAEWNFKSRHQLEGHKCHDIIEDEEGVLWHSASMSGEIMATDGRRAKISNELMTRGIALSPTQMIVGLSAFGSRQKRDAIGGGVVILDRSLKRIAEMKLVGPPTDIIAL